MAGEPEAQRECIAAQNTLNSFVGKENKVEIAYTLAQETKKLQDSKQVESTKKLQDLENKAREAGITDLDQASNNGSVSTSLS